MKNYMKVMAAGFAGLLLFACSSNEADVISSDDPVEIRLKGALGAVSASTRGDGPIGGDYENDGQFLADGDLIFTMFRADAEYIPTPLPSSYQFSGEWVPIEGTANLSGNIITLNPRQYYNIHQGNTRMIGVYPSLDNLPSPLNGSYGGNLISYTGFDGTVDIMTTQMVEGSRLTPSMKGGYSDEMIFSHLLSQVTVNLYGVTTNGNSDAALANELEQINAKWGITEIRVKDGLNPNGEISVQLPDLNAVEYGYVKEEDATHPWEMTPWNITEAPGSRATIEPSTYDYSGEAINGYHTLLTPLGFTIGWKNELDLSTNKYGSALVLPKSSDSFVPSLTILLCCNDRWFEVPVNTITNWEAGKSYVVNIGVSITAIEVTGQIVKWIKEEAVEETLPGFDE